MKTPGMGHFRFGRETTVAQPLVKMGRSAAELLDQAVNGKGKVGQTLLPVWICERDSVRSPKE